MEHNIHSLNLITENIFVLNKYGELHCINSKNGKIINSNKIQLNNSKYLKNMIAIKLLDNKNINFTNLKSFLKENLLKKNFSIPKNFFRIVDGMGTIRLKKEILGF